MYKLTRKWKSLASLQEESFQDYRRHSKNIIFGGHLAISPRSSQDSEMTVNLAHSFSASDSSNEVFIVSTSDQNQDSGLGEEVFGALENKIDQLNDLYLEQCRLLSDIKDEVRCSKHDSDSSGPSLVMELLIKALHLNCSQLSTDPVPEEAEDSNKRARSLLDALQSKRAVNLDREIAQALVDFLQSEELTTRIASAAVAAVRDSVRDTLAGHMSRLYVPTLERCQRRLVKHVTAVLEDAFIQLEQHTASRASAFQRSAMWLRRALDRHHGLLRSQRPFITNTLQRVLEKELQQLREGLKISPDEWETADDEEVSSPDLEPTSPPQPADPNTTIIDQLMMTAEINKLIQNGDVNGAFEKALSASDLSLVMAACRSISPQAVLGPPCRVMPSVVLSLLQQLCTDMVHDTQLKCRYLEEALISLNTSLESVHAHLPLVLGDVRKNLTSFLAKYPSHLASRRIMLIVMAADNLLK